MNGSFTGANIISILLRKKFTARHWLRVLANINKYPCNGSRQEKPQYYRTTESDTSSYFVIYGQYLTDLHHHNVVPKTTLEDVLSGRVQCQKRFEVLGWKSHIPPYRSYIYSCDIFESSEIKKENHRANTDQVKKKGL